MISSISRLIFFGSFCCVASAAELNNFEGRYGFSSADIIDAVPTDKQDRLVIFIAGKAARETYEKMQVKAKEGLCDPDLMIKNAGGLMCSKDTARGEYYCSVGLLLKSGKSVDVSTC